MSALARVLWGLGLGILTGLFFGESASMLSIADALWFSAESGSAWSLLRNILG